jgi:hypothetical protein
MHPKDNRQSHPGFEIESSKRQLFETKSRTGNVLGVTADQNNWNTNAPNPDAMNTSRQSAGANGANAGARVATLATTR